MKGLLVITGKKMLTGSYFGFNGGFGIELWRNIDKWNAMNPENKIRLEKDEDFCDIANINAVKKYFDFIKATESLNEYIYLIIIDTNVLDTCQYNGFDFIGYDCGYLRGDGFSLLFSSIPNELLRDRSVINNQLLPFVNLLNKHGLFDNYNDALAFQNERDELILNGNTQGIETAFKLFSIVKVYLYGAT